VALCRLYKAEQLWPVLDIQLQINKSFDNITPIEKAVFPADLAGL
jgi:hypothetical protein